MSDARFEDGADNPVLLIAQDGDDLQVISALVQDAVLTGGDLKFTSKRREFALLVNRFRWEDGEAAERAARSYERVRSILMFRDVQSVQVQGIDQNEAETVLSLLSVQFEPGEDGTGLIVLTLAGDGAVKLQVEALDATLRDVTRPYAAPSQKRPDHPV